MLLKPNWNRSLERWLAFWGGRLADRPPVLAHVDPSGGMGIGPAPSLDDTLAYYDPSRNGPILDGIEKRLLQPPQLDGDDSPPAAIAGGGVFFSGAVFGAPVRATSCMMTSDPIIDDWGQLDEASPNPFSGYDPANSWVVKTLDLARQLVVRSRGRFAVIPGLMEGPSDICGNLRGTTRLAGDLFEHPREVRRLAELAADGWRAFAAALFDIVPFIDGGSATQWGLWTPGRGAALQEDFCTLLSPRQYRDWFAPFDCDLARCADITWMHLHAGQIHLVEEVLRIDEIRGVQIVYDGDATPPLSRTLPAMQSVPRAGKCLILRKFPPRDLDEILPHLSPRRLAIDVYFATSEEATTWFGRLEKWSSKEQS